MFIEYINICREERKKAGLTYDENKTVWEQLFRCPAPGCIVRTIYFKIFNDHVDAGFHCYNPREGLRYPAKTKTRVVEGEGEELAD